MAEREIAGWVSTPDVDFYGDTVWPSAFKDTLAEWKTGQYVVPLLDHHNSFGLPSVVGRMTDATISRRGVFATFEVAETAEGDRALALAGDYVKGLSIGFRLREAEPVDNPDQPELRRKVKKLDLREVSLVSFPANRFARVEKVNGRKVAEPKGSTADYDVAEPKGSMADYDADELLQRIQQLRHGPAIRKTLALRRRS